MATDGNVFVHEKGLCESDSVGAGTRVWAFAQVMKGAVVGTDCNLCGGVFIESGACLGDGVVVKNGVQVWDGVRLGDGVFVGPNATFTNDRRPRAGRRPSSGSFEATVVRDGATIGANATLRCGVTIGTGAFVGAGAVVVRDVPAYSLVVGVPARAVGWVCACGEQLDDKTLACNCGRAYQRVDDEAGLRLLS